MSIINKLKTMARIGKSSISQKKRIDEIAELLLYTNTKKVFIDKDEDPFKILAEVNSYGIRVYVEPVTKEKVLKGYNIVQVQD